MTTLKTLQAVLLCIGLFYCSGCNVEPKQLRKWDIVITSPNGERKTHTVMSYAKPRPEPQWGGQTKVLDHGHSSYHDWEQQIVAPAGWMLTVETSQ